MQKGVNSIGFSTFISVYNPECREQSNKDFRAVERKINSNGWELRANKFQFPNYKHSIYTCLGMTLLTIPWDAGNRCSERVNHIPMVGWNPHRFIINFLSANPRWLMTETSIDSGGSNLFSHEIPRTIHDSHDYPYKTIWNDHEAAICWLYQWEYPQNNPWILVDW